jgi:hypothetical protein
MESSLYAKNLIHTSVEFNMRDLFWKLSVVSKFFQNNNDDDNNNDNKDADDDNDNIITNTNIIVCNVHATASSNKKCDKSGIQSYMCR